MESQQEMEMKGNMNLSLNILPRQSYFTTQYSTMSKL